jgi:poly-beta-hydroxyalkanoate depolymerase
MTRSRTFFTLDVYEAAAVAQALRNEAGRLRSELKHPANTPVVAERFSRQLAHCEEISERLRRRFAKARCGIEGIMEVANAR